MRTNIYTIVTAFLMVVMALLFVLGVAALFKLLFLFLVVW